MGYYAGSIDQTYFSPFDAGASSDFSRSSTGTCASQMPREVHKKQSVVVYNVCTSGAGILTRLHVPTRVARTNRTKTCLQNRTNSIPRVRVFRSTRQQCIYTAGAVALSFNWSSLSQLRNQEPPDTPHGAWSGQAQKFFRLQPCRL